MAAKRTGVPLSTVYRWRKRDAAFRERWDDILLQRRQIVEDRLMAIIREGELRSAHYKGLEIGWRRALTHRVAIRALDYFDRRSGDESRHYVSRSDAAESVKKPEESKPLERAGAARRIGNGQSGVTPKRRCQNSRLRRSPTSQPSS